MKKVEQEWYDENRQRFDAETTKAFLIRQKCEHKPTRKDSWHVECRLCGIGWIDNGKVFPLAK